MSDPCTTDAAFSRWLDHRLGVFIDAGWIARLPTRWQLRQAELEMTPWVVSPDVTSEEHYNRRRLGHPLLRQPLIVAHVGLDHFRTGSGLGAKLASLCRHLELTFHRGMPVFDLQVIHTHPEGLATLRRSMDELLAGASRRARRQNAVADAILVDRRAYYRRFLGDEGWIARAERLDYPGPELEGSDCPPEFFSLVHLVNYAAEAFEADPRVIPFHRRPAHVLRLLGRRFREGRGTGWLG